MCLVAGFMTLLDVSIVNVALPSIRNDLRSPESDLQWVLSGYSLAFGLLLIPAGRLGDARGRREVFLAGLAVFTLASVACGAAPSSFWLVVARVVQGLGGALISPQISALIQQMFSGQERGRAFGMFSTVVAISTAVGPLLGGLLIQAAGREGAGVGCSSSTCHSASSASCSPGASSRTHRQRAAYGRGTSIPSAYSSSVRACWPCCCPSSRHSSGPATGSGCWWRWPWCCSAYSPAGRPGAAGVEPCPSWTCRCSGCTPTGWAVC